MTKYLSNDYDFCGGYNQNEKKDTLKDLMASSRQKERNEMIL